MNYHVELHSTLEVERIKMQEKLDMQRVMLGAVLFHDPERGNELYDEMHAALDDDESSDDAWITNPQAKTANLASLEHVIKRRLQDRERTEREHDTGN